ncbi:AAA family ATPase [Rhizobium mongolense]
MKFTQVQNVKSLENLEAFDLPQFSLITGPNGSGKSHLLQAIHSNAIVVEDDIPRNLYTYENFRPVEAQAFSPRAENELWEKHKPAFLGAIATAKAHVDNWRGPIDVAKARDEVNEITRPYLQNIANKTDVTRDFALLRLSLGKELWELTEEDLLLPFGRSGGLIDREMARSFANYRDRLQENKFNLYRNDLYQEAHLALPIEQFLKKAGPPPWDILNDQLSNFGLPYRAIPPSDKQYDDYDLMLKHKERGHEIRVSDLSTGEQTIMQLAVCCYKFDGTVRQKSLLLLDEVDAFLHPALCAQYLKTIQEVLIDKFQMSVIATTHSPTTVALAPEASLFLMSASGPKKVTKSVAVNALTEGVPTLSIDFEGRRQVFVEADLDAKIYDLVYRFLKRHLASERSLEFIPVGNAVNGGCAKVIALTSQLSEFGNRSILGLIDYDNSNQQQGRIYVNGSRYSIENFICDPLLLAASILLNFPSKGGEAGLKNETIGELLQCDNGRLQQIAEAVSRRLWEDASFTEPVQYVGGYSLLLDQRSLSTNGHDLANHVLATFPFLRRIRTAQHDDPAKVVLIAIAEKVARHVVDFLPKDIELTLRRLLDADL